MSGRIKWGLNLAVFFLVFTSCHATTGSTGNFNLFETWVVQSADIKDESGILPAATKLQMELAGKGQVWKFNTDSTITMKLKVGAETSGSMPFSITVRDGHTLLVIGESVAELANMTQDKMDLIMSQGVTFTMHMVKKQGVVVGH